MDEADRIQGLLNIPVVVVGGTLEESGRPSATSASCSAWRNGPRNWPPICDGVISEAKANVGQADRRQRPTVYYAEGMKGLNTDAEGSEHTEVLELVGGDQRGPGGDAVGLRHAVRSRSSRCCRGIPEVILVASDKDQESTAYQQITTGRTVEVGDRRQGRQVYQIPRGPFDWFDRPPSISRILGVRWLGNLLYPDLYQYDMRG